jgi:ribosomal protein S18 acetylase RimI-like enzyme
MDDLDLLPLSQDDIPDTVALWQGAGLTRPWNDPADDARLAIAGPSSAILGGRIGGVLAATVMVGWDGHRGSVYYLAVAEDFRGRGYGRALMAAAETWLARFNAPKLNLMVRNDNSAVLSFYDRLGYAVDAVQVRSRRLGN